MMNSQVLLYLYSRTIIINPNVFSMLVLPRVDATVKRVPRKAVFSFVNHIVCRAQLAVLCFSHSGAQLRQKGYKGECKLRCLQ